MQFSSYVTPMDRDYGRPSEDEPSTNDVGLGIKDIGWGLPMGIGAQNIQGIAAKIREGAGSIEIQFAGTGGGNRQAQTPEMYGKEHRVAIREMAEINEVSLTTHAGFGVMGLSGVDPRSGNFSREYRKMAVDEIKRAIEFSADAAKGGSVVVHTGEYQRPISEEVWAKDPKTGKHIFKAYEEEPEEAVVRVLDDRTGQVMTQVRKNQEVARPVWLRNEKNEYIDYEGKVISRKYRVPVYDPASGRFKVNLESWDYFEKEAKELNNEKAKEMNLSLSEFTMRHPNKVVDPEEAFMRAQLEANEGHAKGWALQYAHGFEKAKEDLEKSKKALEFYKKLEASTPESERWKLARQKADELSHMGLAPAENKMPSEIIEDHIKQLRRSIEYEHQASVSQESLAADSRKTQEHVTSIRKYALDQSFKSYAEAGIYAYDKTRVQNLERPVMITMENIFPESYGSHPDELKNLVLKSREKMVEMLHKERNMPMKEAEKLAETHIKATLDTGHFNVWRKYWQNDAHKSMKENDDNFKGWILEKTEELAKQGIVGNLHLADNFGYQDEHLTPGEGNAPIKEIVQILKKHGYEGAITVEAGAAATTDVSDFHGLMKTWRLFGSPVYGAHGAVTRADMPKGNWSNIQYSYFGQTAAPYYIFGAYSPSQDWTLWSQTPME